MTDKEQINNFAKDINVPHKEQIIIDGVDVSKCEGIDLNLHPLVKCKFLKFKTSDGGIAGIWCFDHTKCNFKQLARKTQECEQIKEKYEALKLENQEGYEIVAELKHECEELLKENQQLRNSLSDSLMFKFTGQENETNRYRKALEEIEEYIKRDCGCECTYCLEQGDCKFQEILDIISRAKDCQ